MAAGTRHQRGAAVFPELAQQPDWGIAGFSFPSGRNENTLWRLEGVWVTDGCVDLLQS